MLPFEKVKNLLLANGVKDTEFEIVEIQQLATVLELPGLTKAKAVRILSENGAPSSTQTTYVYKGADYQAWKASGTVDPAWDRCNGPSMIHELLILCQMSPHPNIIPRPPILVVSGPNAGVFGFLQPWRAKETLESQILDANKKGDRIPLHVKTKWCLELANVLAWIHRELGSFHMDMKPGNILVEDDNTLRIIDWQQQGVSRFTGPPEAEIDADLTLLRIVDRMIPVQGENHEHYVVFSPQEGREPEAGLREAYYLWKEVSPRGIEAAEVYMLGGRTMWMLLEQFMPSKAPTVWTDKSADIPDAIKQFVERCLSVNPVERPRLDELVSFWRSQAGY